MCCINDGHQQRLRSLRAELEWANGEPGEFTVNEFVKQQGVQAGGQSGFSCVDADGCREKMTT